MLERPDSGDVELRGVRNPRIGSGTGRALPRSRVSYLFQNFALADDADVATKLRIPLQAQRVSRRERATRMQAALEQVGLDVALTDRISTLSGGEQQRLTVARLLLRPADVVLADEPTGSLDPANRDAIPGLLKDLHSSGRAVVVVTHDPVVAVCDRAVPLVASERRPG